MAEHSKPIRRPAVSGPRFVRQPRAPKPKAHQAAARLEARSIPVERGIADHALPRQDTPVCLEVNREFHQALAQARRPDTETPAAKRDPFFFRRRRKALESRFQFQDDRLITACCRATTSRLTHIMSLHVLRLLAFAPSVILMG